MTPFDPFEVGQVDEFHDLSAMQVHVDDCIADLDDVVDWPVAIHLLMSNPVM